jgi:hypothetical protein
MPQSNQYKRVPKFLTPEDKAYIKMVAQGGNRSKHFREAYPNHPTVQKYMDIVRKQESNPEERTRLRQSITQLSKDKLQASHIQSALMTYQSRMDNLAEKALVVADDLLDNGSDKIKKDLAIEFIRHKVGTPVQKVQVASEQNITLSFGEPHPDDNLIDLEDIPEADIVEE